MRVFQWFSGGGEHPGLPALSHLPIEEAVSTHGQRLTRAAYQGIMSRPSNTQR